MGLATFTLLAAGTGATRSGWAAGSVTNGSSSARTAGIALTHTYGAQSCSTTERTVSVNCNPTLGTQASPPAQSSDSITNNSDGTLTQTVTGASCGVVQLANAKVSSDPLLPRSGTTFSPSGGPAGVSGSGAVTFDATGYATGVVSQTLGGTPGGISLGATFSYGYGIWFKSSAATARIFGLATSPSNSPSSGSTTYDRTLSLTGGKLQFVAAGGPTATSARTYNDGSWHYAYVSLTSQALSLLAGLTTSNTSTIYVDGTEDGSGSNGGLLGPSLATPSGYWSIGGGGFAGSLSNFAVYNGTGSPTSPPVTPYGGATELWQLNDNGYTTTTATLPTAIANPCSKVNIAFAFTSPPDSIASGSLASFANGFARSIGAPAAGQTQALTISTAPGTGYTSDIKGLHLYVPLTFGYGMGSGWGTTMTWAGNALDVFWA